MKQQQLFKPKFPINSLSYRSLRESWKRLNVWEGSVRSGKTIASIARWLLFVRYEAPIGGSLIMTGRTNKTLERNVINPIMDMLGGSNVRYNRGIGRVHLLGRDIDIVGASDERAQEKIRGSTIVGAYGDEITLWPESFFKMMLSRLSVKGSKFFGTTNPDGPYHWLKRDYLDRKDQLNLASWHFRLADNPYLDPDYVQSIKAEYTGLWRKRFINGLWVLAEGSIYDMWDEAAYTLQVQQMLEREARTGLRREAAFQNHFVAVDYGTSNPCTFGLYGYDQGPPVYLLKEYYWDSTKTNRQKTDAQYAQDFKGFLGQIRPRAIYVDPSAASFIAELRHQGFSMIIRDARNDVLDGIRFVGSMLSNNQFFVDKSCQATIQEFSSYVWDLKAARNGEDKPIKQHDHTMDRNRYGLYSHFFKERPIILAGFNYR